MRKKIIVIAAIALVLIGMGVLLAAHHTSSSKAANGKLPVMVTYYPLYDFVKEVGGNKVDTSIVTPAGSAPYNYTPSAQTLATARKSKVFVYNGADYEPWVDDFLNNYTHVKIKAGDNVQLLTITDAAGKQTYDPYFWLDPVLAMHTIDNIRDGLSIADPTNAGAYAQNAEDYKTRLTLLAADYAQGLAACKLHTVVTARPAFGYVAKRYGFDAQAANPANPETVVLDTIEGVSSARQKQGNNYIALQTRNLASLRKALMCQ